MFSLRYPSSSSLYAFLLLAAVSVQTQIAAGQDSSTGSPRAQTAAPVPPPLSTHRAQFFRNNPAARAESVSYTHL